MHDKSIKIVTKILNFLPGIQTLIICMKVNYIHYYKSKVVDDTFYIYVKE